MKKLLVLVSAIILIFTFAGCGNGGNGIDIEKDSDLSDMPSQNDGGTTNPEESDNYTETSEITREREIEIALNHAGLTENEVFDLGAEREMENGKNVWDVDFKKDNIEYSYEINRTTGDIIKSEKETDLH
jgi:uncharacterized membrane protein YkoI